MQAISSKLIKTILLSALKILLLSLSIHYLYNRVTAQDFEVLLGSIGNLFQANLFFIFILFQILALVLQWGIETLRWSVLVSFVHPITLFQSLKVVMMSATLGVITPYRLGDFAGRLIGVEPEHRRKVLLRAAVSSICMTQVIVIFGLIALTIININLGLDFNVKFFSYLFLIIIVLVNIILITLKKFMYSKYNIRTHIYLKTIGLSALKFLVYTAQFMAWIIFISGVDFTIDYIYYSWLTFSIQSFLPSFILVDIGVRGAVSLFVWNELGFTTVNILLAVSCMWIVNILVPMLMGTIWLMKLKFKNIDISKSSSV